MQEIKLNLSIWKSHENLLRIALLMLTLLFGGLSSAEDNFRLPAEGVSAFVGSDSEFLPVSKAFVLNLALKEAARVEVNWSIEDGYYLYKHRFKVTPVTKEMGVEELNILPGLRKVDEWFGEVEVYYSTAQLSFLLDGLERFESVEFELSYQGCAEAGLCYPPVTQRYVLSNGEFVEGSKEVRGKANVELEKREEQKLADALLKESVAWSLFLFFVGGVALAFTPCVFPMIPILSSIIVGQGSDLPRYRAFALSGSYVAGMAITYAIIGTLVGVFGAQLNLQAALQTTPILLFSASLFVILSLAMFGFYELQLPVSWQNKLNELSSLQSGGKYVSVFIMGALSSLVISPCISAPLVGGLLYISQTQDALLGGLALLSLGLGMGVPLMVVGVVGGVWFPKAGAWMDQVKGLFGFLLIGVAIWLIERLVEDSVAMLLWGLLLIGAAIYFGAFEFRTRKPVEKAVQFVGVVVAIWGGSILVGSGLGSSSIFDPFGGLRISSEPQNASELEGKGWQTVKTLEEVQNFIEQNDRPVILDVYADWCISCKIMEKNVFTESRVRKGLREFGLLRVDVTANDELDRELLTHFGLFGPPTLAFFGEDGVEITEVRIQGEIDADAFSKHLSGVSEISGT